MRLCSSRIATSGDKERIPPTSDELAGEGTWSTFDPAGDTTVLTTFSVEPDMRHYPVDGRNLTDVVFDGFASVYSGTEYRISYTPLVGSGLRLHWRHEARPVAFFKNARPYIEHVVIWGYKWPAYDRQLLEYISSMFKLC